MAALARHHFLYRLLRNLRGHPSIFLEMASAILIAWIIGWTAWGLGGYVYFAQPMATTVRLVGALLVLHGIWWVVQPERPRKINPWGFLFVPFLVYAAWQTYAWSPAGWQAELEFSVWLQASAIYWVVVQQFKAHRPLWLMLWGIVLVGLIVFTAGMYQSFWRPDWLPWQRVLPAIHEGRVSATFGVPNNTASFYLVLIPMMAVCACLRRLPSYARMLSAFMAVMFTVGLFMTISRAALLVFAGLLVLLPIFLHPERKYRLRLMVGIVLCGLLSLMSMFYLSYTVRQRVIQFVEQGGEVSRPVIWQTAWDMFLDSPVFGGGAASFSLLWDRYRPPEVSFTSRYVHSDYLNWLSEYGIVGFLLIMLPVLWLMGRGFSYWRKQPFYKMGRQQVFRESRQGENAPELIVENGYGYLSDRRLSSKLKHRLRKEGYASSAKLLIGGAVLGLIAVGLHALVDFPFHIPVILFLVMIWLALLARYVVQKRWNLPGQVWEVPAILIIFVLAGVGLWIHGYGLYRAQGQFLLADEAFDAARGDQEIMLYEQHRFYDALDQMQEALLWNPEHGRLLATLADSIIYTRNLSGTDERELAQRALPYAEQAIDVSPDDWYGYHTLAEILAILPGNELRRKELLVQARELAPRQPTTSYELARFMIEVEGDGEAAMRLVEEAIHLDPAYKPALDLRARLRLR